MFSNRLLKSLAVLPLLWAIIFNLLIWISAQATAATPNISAVPSVVLSGEAAKGSPLDENQAIQLTIVIMPKEAELTARVNAILDPHSPLYRHFLSFADWKKSFAPTDADGKVIETWAEKGGLKSIYHSGSNLSLVINGTVEQAEHLLSVNLSQYKMAGQTYYSNDKAATVPARVAPKIVDILGLSSFGSPQPVSALPQPSVNTALPETAPTKFKRLSQLRVEADGSLPYGTLRPSLRPAFNGPFGLNFLEPANLWSASAYNFQGLAKVSHCCNSDNVAGGSPKETTIAIIGTDKPLPADIKSFFTDYNLASNYLLNEVGSPACCDGEMTLDVEWAGAMSNSFDTSSDTATVIAYAGNNTYQGLFDVWDAAFSDDKARIASSSFGRAEDDFGGIGNPSISSFTIVTHAMIAAGWTIVAAAGDSGGDGDCSKLGSVIYPASDPNVVAAGGTTLSLTGGSKLIFGSETAWSGKGCAGTTNGGGGGGGCCSNTFFKSNFQPASCSSNRRALPDISLNAGSGQVIYYSFNKCANNFCSVGGTSIVAPELAGFFAQENSYLLSIGKAGAICGSGHNAPCGPLGQPLAALYAAPNQPHDPIYDVTSDCTSNCQSAGFCAGVGYDRATGLGSANMLQLAWALNSYLNPGGSLPVVQFGGPTSGHWYSSQQTVTFQITPPSTGLAGYTAALDHDPGNTTRASSPSNGTRSRTAF